MLLGASDSHDPFAARLAEALNSDGAQCVSIADPIGSPDTARLRALLSGGGQPVSNGHAPLKGLTGVVVVAGAADGAVGEAHAGRDHVSHLAAVARELSELPGGRHGCTS